MLIKQEKKKFIRAMSRSVIPHPSNYIFKQSSIGPAPCAVTKDKDIGTAFTTLEQLKRLSRRIDNMQGDVIEYFSEHGGEEGDFHILTGSQYDAGESQVDANESQFDANESQIDANESQIDANESQIYEELNIDCRSIKSEAISEACCVSSSEIKFKRIPRPKKVSAHEIVLSAEEIDDENW